eukprot:UN14517
MCKSMVRSNCMRRKVRFQHAESPKLPTHNGMPSRDPHYIFFFLYFDDDIFIK